MIEASSGDLLADRRYLYGRALSQDGDHRAAADLFLQTVERAPHWAAGWFALGEARSRSGDRDGAVSAFETADRLDVERRLGAPLALASLGGTAVPSDAGNAYVRALFDDYAPRFEAHLQGSLAYRAPAALIDALERVAPGRRYAHALDLGCGTGLAGVAMRSLADRLDGVDLSPAMVEQARGKAVYDQLAVRDMMEALHDTAGSGPAFDLVVAADVLVYVGDLGGVFAGVVAALVAGGLFAFTLQRTADCEAVSIGPDRRFAHSREHVLARASETGLRALLCDDLSTRRDGGIDVAGLLVVLEA